MGAIASQIASLTIVYSTAYSDADERKHQSSVSLAFVWGIHRGPVNSPHKRPVTRKMFPIDDVIMYPQCTYRDRASLRTQAHGLFVRWRRVGQVSHGSVTSTRRQVQGQWYLTACTVRAATYWERSGHSQYFAFQYWDHLFRYRDPHYKDKTVVRPCYLCNRIPILVWRWNVVIVVICNMLLWNVVIYQSRNPWSL